jgi:hypothetical protein
MVKPAPKPRPPPALGWRIEVARLVDIRRIAIAAAILGGALGVGAVWAQTAAQDAKAFVTPQAPALAAGPTTAPTLGAVPGYAGEQLGLQSLSADPTALQAAGQTAAFAGSEPYGVAQSGLAAPARAGIEVTDSWLAASRDVHANPMAAANAGGATVTGSESQACTEETRTDTQTSTSLYTCETSTSIAVNTASCQATYQPNVVSYTAVCTETFNSGTGRFEPSAECATVGGCQAGARTCTTPSTPVTARYDCQEGYTETSTTETGAYDCQEGYVEGSAPASCEETVTPVIQYGAATGWCALPTPANGYADQCRDAWGMPQAGWVMCDEMWDAAGGHWANFCGSPYDAGSTVATTCGSMGACTQTSATCVEGPATYVFEGVPVQRDCWRYQYSYSCPGGRTDAAGCAPPQGAALLASDCAATDATGACTEWNRHYQVTTTTITRQPAAGCSPPPGAQMTGSACAAQDAAGGCTLWNQSYEYTDDPAGGCAQWSTNYACTRDAGGTWSEDAACPSASDAACAIASQACLEGPSTRTIDGATIYAACWRRETSYSCTTRSETDNCHPDPSCTKTSDTCLDDPGGPDGCLTVDHEYACTASTSTTTTVRRCENQMCLGDSCFTLARDQNGDFAKVYSQLAALQQGGKDYATNPDFTVFKGSPLRCKKAVLGFANCCKDSGWGISIGLARCDEQERQLIVEQDKKATHYVGTYCSNKSLFGVCLEKAMSYCGFGSPLPRIIQEAGRPQVGKGWGAPKTPDCSGFTVDQFQQLDLTDVDFSDFYRDKLAGFATPDTGGTVSNIQSSIEALYANGTPRSGPL